MEELNLVSIERQLITASKTRETIEKEYEKKLQEVDLLMHSLRHTKNMLLNNCDALKIANAKNFIYTRGCKKNFYGDASQMVEKVIKDVAQGCKILLHEYIGCKDYSSFFGQGITCQYGYRPSHGSVVMEIGTTSQFRKGEIAPTEDDYSDILYFLNLLLEKETRLVILDEYE